MKLDSLGTLVNSTYYGDTGHDAGVGIALGPDASAYVVGDTNSSQLPVLNPLSLYGNSFDNAMTPFLAVFNVRGSGLKYATWLGPEWTVATAAAIATDATGAAYVVGSTYNYFPLGLIPGMPNGYQQSPRGSQEGYAVKIAPGGVSVVYGTFLGGSGDDSPTAVAVDAAGNAHIVGVTRSVDFPSTNCFRGYGGGQDAFLATLSPDGTQLLHGTFFGGTGNDQASDVAVHAGRLYVTGATDSADLPLASPLQSQLQGSDAFVATVDLATAAASAGTILLGQQNISAYELGGSASVLVNRMCGNSGAVSIGYHTSTESAVPGVNYTEGTGTVTFADGDVSPKVINVSILDDQSLVCGLTFDVSLDPQTVNPPGSSVGLQTSTVTIIDNTGVTKVRARLNVANPDGATAWAVISDSAWLTVDVGSGTTPSTLTAIADGSQLSDGTYGGLLTFTLPGSGAQFVVPITFVVGSGGGG